MSFVEDGVINIKIVIDGLGLSGKKTTIANLAKQFPYKDGFPPPSNPIYRDPIAYIDKDKNCGYYLYALPLELDGTLYKFWLFTRFHYLHTTLSRELLYKGADALIYVVDSRANRLEGNLKAREDIDTFIEKNITDRKLLKAVQYIHFDVPDNEKLSILNLESLFNRSQYISSFTLHKNNRSIKNAYLRYFQHFSKHITIKL